MISLEVRSNLLEGEGVIVPEGSKAASRKGDKTSELPYMVILNNNLPSDIRVLSWAAVDSSFSARFSCLQRTYKYFFPRGEMNLDVSTYISVMFFLYTCNYQVAAIILEKLSII